MSVLIPNSYPASAVYVSGGCGQEHTFEASDDARFVTFSCKACEQSLRTNGHGPQSWWLEDDL